VKVLRIPSDALVPLEKLTSYLLVPREWDDKSKFLAQAGFKGEEVMSRPLYQRVALNLDLPEQGLKKGDVATLVDYVPGPEGGEPGCVLEVFNALGESIAIVAVRESEIEGLHAGEVLAVRPLAKAG